MCVSRRGNSPRMTAQRSGCGRYSAVSRSTCPPAIFHRGRGAGMVCHWWTRAVVDADGVVEFYDDGSVWLAENGLA